jgi:hypothetical protein
MALIKSSGYNIIIFLLGLFLLGQIGLGAETFRKENYQYQKTVSPKSSAKGLNWGAFDLDPEVYKNSKYSDLRLVYGDKSIPYQRMIKKRQDGRSGKWKPQVLFNKQTPNGRNLVYEVPQAQSDLNFTQFQFSIPRDYEANVKIYLGNTLDDWDEQRSDSLYSYNSDTEGLDTLDIRSKSYRFIRIEADETDEISLQGIFYEPKWKGAEFSASPEVPSPNWDPDQEAQVYYFPNESGTPFRDIELKFQNDDYSRDYRLYVMNENKEYAEVRSGTLTRDSKTKSTWSTIPLYETYDTAWKLVIFQADNPELKLEEVKISHPLEEVIFMIPEDFNTSSEAKSLTLFYGYKYAKYPSFDLTGYPNQVDPVKFLSFQLSAEEINPDKRLSLFEPPISIWFIRVIFLLGLLLSGFYGWKVLQVWGEGNEEQPKDLTQTSK